MLAEMYEFLKEDFPTHGLEIVFVSSDRDANSFRGYFVSMPWLSIPFESLGLYKSLLSATYGVRGIPSLIILDSVSGQIVVPNTESRQQIMQACRGGDSVIKTMFQRNWLDRVPAETKQLLDMLDASCATEGNQKEKATNASSEAFSFYLVRKECTEADVREKALILQLIDEGMEAEDAMEAAKAVEEVSASEQQKSTLEAGRLTGVFQRRLLSDNDSMNRELTPSQHADGIRKESGRDTLITVLSTTLKYLKNCRASPWSPKFRSFQLSFKVADRIGRVSGSLPLLQSLGFEISGTTEDFVASIPVYADVDAMYDKTNQLLKAHNEE